MQRIPLRYTADPRRYLLSKTAAQMTNTVFKTTSAAIAPGIRAGISPVVNWISFIIASNPQMIAAVQTNAVIVPLQPLADNQRFERSFSRRAFRRCFPWFAFVHCFPPGHPPAVIQNHPAKSISDISLKRCHHMRPLCGNDKVYNSRVSILACHRWQALQLTSLSSAGSYPEPC